MFVDGSITGTMIQAGTIDAVHLKASSITAGKIAAGAINVGNLIADDVIVTGHLQVNSVAVVSVSSPADQIGIPDNTSAPRLIATLTVFVVAGGGNLLIQGGFNINSIPGGVGSGSFPATSQADYRFLMSYIQINFDFGLQETPDPADGGLHRLHDHHGQPTKSLWACRGRARVSSDRPVLDTLAIRAVRSQPELPGRDIDLHGGTAVSTLFYAVPPCRSMSPPGSSGCGRTVLLARLSSTGRSDEFRARGLQPRVTFVGCP